MSIPKVAAALVAAAAIGSPSVAFAQEAPPSDAYTVFVYVIVILVLFGALLAVFWVRNAVQGSAWSLADALSEEVDIALMGPAGPQLDAQGKQIIVTVMRASSSRLIALMGMIAILFLFLGFGTFILYRFAIYGTTPGSTRS